jgi:hypothetical protein
VKNKVITGGYTGAGGYTGPVDKKGRPKVPMVSEQTRSNALTGNKFIDLENERQREIAEVKLICIYTYIYIYMYMNVYIYIYEYSI